MNIVSCAKIGHISETAKFSGGILLFGTDDADLHGFINWRDK